MKTTIPFRTRLVLETVCLGIYLTAATQAEGLYNEPYRPQFHFTYKVGWLSDINGPIYYDGEYHLFTQHCPEGPGLDYATIHWGHAISEDLIHWKELPPALAPDKLGPIFSGSMVVDKNNTGGFQEGDKAPMVAFYTGAAYIIDDNREGVICLAYSNDRGRTWTKYANNPVLPAITHYNRDPKVFWHKPTKKWIMVIALSHQAWEDDFAFLQSEDLKKWQLLSTHRLPGAGDCPDMFELPVDGDTNNMRWVLWGGSNHYIIGTFDDGRHFCQEGKALLGELGTSGYAAQSWGDHTPDGRRIQTSWMYTTGQNLGDQYRGMPFNQQASFPVRLTLRTTPQGIRLFREPIKEIEVLHQRLESWENLPLGPDSKDPLSGVTGELFDLRATIDVGTAAEVAFRINGQLVQYDVNKQVLSSEGKIKTGADVSTPMAPIDNKVTFQILVDRTSIEVFANDGRYVMSFFRPPYKKAHPLSLYVKGGTAKIESLKVWRLKSIWPHQNTK